MPAVLEQINGMSVSDKMRIMEYLLKSIALAVNETVAKKAAANEGLSQLLGAASAYAKPSLRNRERTAFRRAMEAKHATIR